MSERGAAREAFRALLRPADGSEELFFVQAPRGGGYVSLSLVLVVEGDFFRGRVEDILEVTSRYEVCVYPARDDTLSPGEVFMNLAFRVCLAALTREAFEFAVENLRAARSALAATFP